MAVELPDLVRVNTEERIRQALTAIKDKHPEKLLVAEQVVDAAQHPDHPLHDYFEWSDDEAALQFRLMQARCLIRKIKVSNPVADGAPVPKYVSLRPDRQRQGGGYRETKEVVNNAELLAQLEETAKRDIEGVLGRYQMLEGLVTAVREALASAKPAGRKKR